MIPRMKTKTRKTRNRTIAKAKAKLKLKTKKPNRKATRTVKSKTARKPKSTIATTANPTPGDNKLLKMPNRVPGTKSDFNLRFSTAGEYQLVKAEAASRGMSMNLFITTAALKSAGATKAS